MRAKKEDIPDYLKPRKKQGPWRALVILGVGSAIFCGLVAVFAKPIVIDMAQLKQTIGFGGEPLFSQPPAEALQGNDQDWIRSTKAQQTIQANRELEEWSRQEAQKPHERQISFSDANYIQKPPANVVPSYTLPNERLESQQITKKVVVIGSSDSRMRDFCPFKEGSLDQRHCKMQSDLWERNKKYNAR